MASIFGSNQPHLTRFGCYFVGENAFQRTYLSQVKLESLTTILADTSSTTLRQTFINTEPHKIEGLEYTFPLYDGASISAFQYTVGDRIITGVVKDRNEARRDYVEAVQSGRHAGLLEQSLDAGDVFTTSIGNVAPGESIVVEITYLGELKNDAQSDGARFSIPMSIAPRYGSAPNSVQLAPQAMAEGGLSITVDVKLPPGRIIRGLQSPSHPISVTIGRLSGAEGTDDSFDNNLANMTLALGSTELANDFVLIVQSKDQGVPKALLETHPTVPNSRVLMTTLVPRFNLQMAHPEIVFMVDRSGSMQGKMNLVIDAMRIFLKSMPVGVKFNIFSFGSYGSALFEKSRDYDAHSVQIALDHLSPNTFQANLGGTEMLQPMRDIIQQRFTESPLEVVLLTDGEVVDQNSLFQLVNAASTAKVRFFTLGIGAGASSSLVEGIARAGNGFSQWVNDNERMDKKLINMLRGALTPQVKYRLELNFPSTAESDGDDFELVESFDKCIKLTDIQETKKTRKVVSLYQPEAGDAHIQSSARLYDNLPQINIPNILQVPSSVPALYSHSRSTVYLFLGPDAPNTLPSSVWLRGQSESEDLELEIQIHDAGRGEMIHKLAAKRAMQDLEEGRGWLDSAQTQEGKYLKQQYSEKWHLVVRKECVRIGTTYQVSGKWCSFIGADSAKPPTELEAYQSGLMILRQDARKGRKKMAPQVASASFPTLFGAVPSPQPPPVQQIQLQGLQQLQQPQQVQNASTAWGSPAYFNKVQPQTGAHDSGGLFFGSPAGLHQNSTLSQTGGLFGNSAGSHQNSNFSQTGGLFGSNDAGQSQFQAYAGDSLRSSSAVGSHSALMSIDSHVADDEVQYSSTRETMMKLIDLQTFTGNWTPVAALLDIFQYYAKSISDFVDGPALTSFVIRSLEAREAHEMPNLSQDGAATICALAWLETVAWDEKEVWEMISDKARLWLRHHLQNSEMVGSSIEAVGAAWKAPDKNA